MSPLASRRFWTLILDVLISTVTFVISTYGTSTAQTIAAFVIATYQPVFIYLINQYTKDDMATNAGLIASGDHPLQQANKAAIPPPAPRVFTPVDPGVESPMTQDAKQP